MSFLVQHIRSGESGRRPLPLDLAPGQLAVNYNSDSPGVFFRTTNGSLAKAGSAHVGPSAPPQTNYTERSIGEIWFDTTIPTAPSLKVYTPGGWETATPPDNSITTAKIRTGAVVSSKITFDDNLIPVDNDTVNIGSPSKRLSVLYTDELNANTLAKTLLPKADNTYNLGSASLRFRNIYTGDLHLRNDRGDWTVIEEEEYLSLRNNKTGKTFRIVMEAVD